MIAVLSVTASAQLLSLLPPRQTVPVIIQIAPTASITLIANVLHGTVVDSIPGANTYLLNLPFLPIAPIASLLRIQWAELNTSVSIPSFGVLDLVTLPATAAPDWYKYQPSWQLIEAPNALQYSTGANVVVADINSLVDYAHPALAHHLTGGYDFVVNRPNGYGVLNQSETSYLDQSETSYLDQSETSYLDQFGAVLSPFGLETTVNPAYSHGTLCAGVIAAIAPESMIMPLRAFDEQGQSDLFTIAKAIRYAVQNRAHVINMSFGIAHSAHSIQSAIQYAEQNNVLLVASAGNDNTSVPQYPAAYSGVMTAAATDLFDRKAVFSNYGSYISVDAPGVNIISAYPGGQYSIVSGTSFSAPTVAATAALVRSLRWTGVADSIDSGSVNIDSRNPDYQNELGYGRIDVLRAVQPN